MVGLPKQADRSLGDSVLLSYRKTSHLNLRCVEQPLPIDI